jgi:transcriptional regulator with XRE-family HTH domain
MGVAEKIKILLLKRKKSQIELAENLGMSHQYLNNKLRQERFTKDELKTIAEFLGASYSEDPPPRQWFTLNDTGEEI